MEHNLSPILKIISVIIASVIPIIINLYSFNKQSTKITEGIPSIAIFYVFGTLIYSMIPDITPMKTIETLRMSGLVTYILLSVTITNSSLRNYYLNDKLKIQNRISLLSNYEKNFHNKDVYQKYQKDIELIMHHTTIAFDTYVKGNFKESILNCYKILFDEYKGEYVFSHICRLHNYSDKREKFDYIRNSIVHAKSMNLTKEEEEEIKSIDKKLFQISLDMLFLLKTEYLDKIII